MGTALFRRFRYCRPPCQTVPRRKKDVMGTALFRRFRYCRPPCLTVPRWKNDVMGTALLRRYSILLPNGRQVAAPTTDRSICGLPLEGTLSEVAQRAAKTDEVSKLCTALVNK